VGILGLGTTLGDRQLDSEEIASRQKTSADSVRRVLGQNRIWLSTKTAEDLGAEAARQCLARCGIAAADIDAVVWCNGSQRLQRFAASAYVQDAIGAENAFTVDLGCNCSEFVTALRTATGLVAEDESIRHVLVVSGEQWGEWVPNRSTERVDEENYPNLLSDGGAAAIVGRSERLRMVGFGFATIGKYCDAMLVEHEVVDGRAYERSRFNNTRHDQGLMALDVARLFRSGLARCLKSSGLQRDQIDHVILPLGPPDVQMGYALAMGVSPKKIANWDLAPTHIGASDVVHALDLLLESNRAQPGQHVIVVARSLGLMRMTAIRI